MKKQIIFLFATTMILMSSCVEDNPEGFVLVKGDSFFNRESKIYKKSAAIADFYMGTHEVTQQEWIEVMGSNPSTFKGENLPVETVSWYDCVEYCNERSIKEGLEPYYTIDKDKKDPNIIIEIDSIRWTVKINKGANGYRLPTEAEWQYAATGGPASKNYKYSGSNDLNEVGWYWRNSGDSLLTGSWHWLGIENNNSSTKPVGMKKPNELGIFDMSGNVREWCVNWYVDSEIARGYFRSWRGGGWIGGEHACIPSYRGKFEPNGKGPDQGFRVCRSKI